MDGSALSKQAKQKMAIAIGKVEKRLIDGADEELQMLQLLTVKWNYWNYRVFRRPEKSLPTIFQQF